MEQRVAGGARRSRRKTSTGLAPLYSGERWVWRDATVNGSVVVPMWVPFVTIVLVVAPIPVGIAHPMPPTSIIVGRMVLGLTPAYVAILVAGHANTVMAVHIAAFKSARDGCGWIK